MASGRVCLGAIAGAHGVKGLVRIKAFTEAPEAVAAYGPLEDETGKRRFRLALNGRAKGALLARIEGVEDRETAQQLAGTRLYLDRERLPEIVEEETYYHADLIGLTAEDGAGRPLGRVVAVHDFGAGDLLELASGEGAESRFVPFTRATVPLVDQAGGRLVVALPEDASDDET